MTDRLESMTILVAAVEAGSLSAGARRLGLPLATVSRRVAELEELLGTQLVQRSPRGLTPTEPGEAYLAACRSILEQVGEAERMAAGEFREPKGLLSLSAPIVFGRLHVLPVVGDFLERHPEVDVRLEQTDRPVSLTEEHFDAVIRIGDLADSALRARRIGEVRRLICASPAYLAARGRPQTPEDLAGHDCISFDRLLPAGRWSFGEGTAERQVRSRARMSVNTAEAAIAAAEAGLGITRVLSYQVAESVAQGRLRIVLAEEEPAPWPVHILFRAGIVPRKLRAFVDFASPRLAAALSAHGARLAEAPVSGT
ncbi:LysR family transcriptional regulator [Salipiger sp. P9]|uniref:LysR family transcriptional regulator n=1 Tax=Salipiger pentaromativorans TaxID=2943193 RepID=UPI00215897ED|nr:LysR family transcriptional regulator [Salipiger pentaromativorans]MCR8549418.1 LysR family transcriptional regulator [Salipiger pentaromativorans]